MLRRHNRLHSERRPSRGDLGRRREWPIFRNCCRCKRLLAGGRGGDFTDTSDSVRRLFTVTFPRAAPSEESTHAIEPPPRRRADRGRAARSRRRDDHHRRRAALRRRAPRDDATSSELDGTFVGDIQSGQISRTLQAGLLDPWRARLNPAP